MTDEKLHKVRWKKAFDKNRYLYVIRQSIVNLIFKSNLYTHRKSQWN